ncbi:hypothetical protein NKG05_23915 [Oerskovia sp. M15]
MRVDSGVSEGDAISGAFDSMIAKVIVTGATRLEAVQRARRALREMVVEGIPTVVPFHRAVLESEDFVPWTTRRSASTPAGSRRRSPTS